MKSRRNLLSFFLIIILAACATPEWGLAPSLPATLASTQTSPAVTIIAPTARATPAQTTNATAIPTQVASTPLPPTPSMAPDAWKSMPIVPLVSAKMVEVYRAGLAAGHDPAHFSKIGDCQNITTYFLANFDNPKLFRLGTQYAVLQPTIDHFTGSWSRQSLAVKPGENVAAALSPLWADPKQCNAGETPIACEIRVYNPGIVTVSMEESWSGDIVAYNKYLRQIVAYILSQNVVPILATRAELPGSSKSINETVARIAYDYQVPLWNFWAATNSLPSHGLTVDGFHLTQAQDYFDDAAIMQAGWPWRNLTALEAIDAVYRAVNGQP
jgi:hypothetical protein